MPYYVYCKEEMYFFKHGGNEISLLRLYKVQYYIERLQTDFLLSLGMYSELLFLWK